jgi:asparagine synthase (glutamine-hydrolysing)
MVPAALPHEPGRAVPRQRRRGRRGGPRRARGSDAAARAALRRPRREHHEIVVERGDIAKAFPRVVTHTERPILRTAPAPLFLLSGLVEQHGIKVVLTGEGADEMFAGYDLFREAKVRRFWAKAPSSTFRPKLLDRLYPYLARSPVAQRAMAQKFFGRNLAAFRDVGFAHEPRWHTTSAVKRLFSSAFKDAIQGHDAVKEVLSTVPAAAKEWSALAQDQWLEIRTLLSSYILSSQGDRMLMAHSVEGRFPFLDVHVAALAASLPPSYKLKVLDEKHVVKRAAADVLPNEILARTKQPYRAPDALSFVTADAPAWVEELLSPPAIAAVGAFDPNAVATLYAKCRAKRDEAQLSNTDNMALVGVLSTQLLHQALLARPAAGASVRFETNIDRTTEKEGT